MPARRKGAPKGSACKELQQLCHISLCIHNRTVQQQLDMLTWAHVALWPLGCLPTLMNSCQHKHIAAV
jgi:hypothetical protein